MSNANQEEAGWQAKRIDLTASAWFAVVFFIILLTPYSRLLSFYLFYLNLKPMVQKPLQLDFL